MNNQQKAEEYAAKIYTEQQHNPYTVDLRDLLTAAVLYGMGMGYDEGFKDGKRMKEIEQLSELVDERSKPIKDDWKAGDSKPLRGGFAEEP